MRKIFIIFVLFLVCSLFSNTNFRVMTYNALNFDDSSTDRTDDFKTVVENSNPDIILMQEMVNSAGATLMLNTLNLINNEYSASTFVNGPDTDNMLYYKSAVATLLSQDVISTTLRDISEYVVSIGGNSIRFYSCHLKAGDLPENVTQRLAEATVLRNYLNSLSEGTEFIIVGDMNFYTSSETGYQKFIASETNNIGKAQDLSDQVGSWHNNATCASVHSQSSRLTSFGGGASGGLDDRFDFIFSSYEINNSAGIEYVADSYTTYGNDGAHFNQSVNEGTNSAVPANVADALYYASDHLPVYTDLVSIWGSEPELIISEYIEGSSYNKAIEIYNGTGVTVDLSAYSLEKDLNGDGIWGNTYNYSGTLAHGEVFVLANSGADPVILSVADDTDNGVINFNGNDQVRLLKNSVEIDRIGIPGDIDFAKDKTYVRKSTITSPASGPQDPGTNGEWDEYAIDTFSYLGSHDMINLFPGTGDLIITEIDTRFSRGVFVEIYNNTASAIDLSNCSLIHYNGSSPANLSAALSGQLASHEYYVIARDQTNFESTYGFTADQYESTMYLNDGIEWLELDNGTRAVIDHFGADGITWPEDHVFERTGYPNNGTSMDDWIDIGDVPGSPNAGNDNPLPVTLSSFNAIYANCTPTLHWTTQSETNNLGWNIYRGKTENALENNTTFCINNSGLIPGAGTTSEPTDYQFTDEYDVTVGQTYWYWLETVDGGGNTNTYGPVTLTIPEEEPVPVLPQNTFLCSNYPNPFNPSTFIEFSIKEGETGKLTIYNVKGQLLETYEYEAGEHELTWDATQYGSGIYFYKLETQSYNETKKMIMLK